MAGGTCLQLFRLAYVAPAAGTVIITGISSARSRRRERTVVSSRFGVAAGPDCVRRGTNRFSDYPLRREPSSVKYRGERLRGVAMSKAEATERPAGFFQSRFYVCRVPVLQGWFF